MRNILLFGLMLSICTTLLAQPKEVEDRRNLVGFSVSQLFVSNLSYSYERLFNNSGFHALAGVTLKDNDTETQSGVNFELQYRVYPRLNKHKAFQGFYLGPYVSYRYLDDEDTGNRWYSYLDSEPQRDFYNSFGVGVAFGCKLAIAQRFVFSFELGGGLKYADGTKKAPSYEIFHPGYTGIAPKMDISLGYFF